ncbi:MAG TPA: phospholipase [Cyanobacteria bacterium UBA11162]|nr:phospholipase [Cyanobacteria bacterium UBA11162]
MQIGLLLWKFLVVVAGLIAIAYFSICVALLVWQNRLIFLPSKVIQTTPIDLGLSYEEVWLPVSNKTGKIERLHGWWIPANSPEKGVLLYLHGNGENISANVDNAKRFHDVGLSVLLIDYQGYGKSEGAFPTEAQVYKDAQVAWNYLVQERGINPEDIFIYGHSLGGAIAIDLAVRNPTSAGLIVQSSFSSMRDMVEVQKIYGLFPTGLILTHKFESIRKIKSLQTPLLLIHGTNDSAVPATMSQVLFDAATVSKKLWLVPGADHNNVGAIAGWDYQQRIQDFITECRRQKGS